MYTLKNSKLKILVKNKGAELCGINSAKDNTTFMWDANPDVWGSYAPNLFPIIGALKNDTYVYENTEYKLPKHGFVRHNDSITLHEQSENSLTFILVSNSALLENYPFKFEFFITYTLIENTLEVKHTIKNTDTKTMLFSVGGHPAFKCPVFKNEAYDDYSLVFEHPENADTHLVNMETGLISAKTKTVINNTNKLPLTHNLFSKDALIFKDLKSKKITLTSANHGDVLTVKYHDFDYLGIWAKPTGDYVCIEPWLGIADNETTNQNLKDKEGIIALEQNRTFEASYTIEIHNKHLV